MLTVSSPRSRRGRRLDFPLNARPVLPPRAVTRASPAAALHAAHRPARLSAPFDGKPILPGPSISHTVSCTARIPSLPAQTGKTKSARQAQGETRAGPAAALHAVLDRPARSPLSAGNPLRRAHSPTPHPAPPAFPLCPAQTGKTKSARQNAGRNARRPRRRAPCRPSPGALAPFGGKPTPAHALPHRIPHRPHSLFAGANGQNTNSHGKRRANARRPRRRAPCRPSPGAQAPPSAGNPSGARISHTVSRTARIPSLPAQRRTTKRPTIRAASISPRPYPIPLPHPPDHEFDA